MNSTLTLIYGSQVLPERNFKVPSLDDIVSTAESYQNIEEFMYVKHAMNLTIKIDKYQSDLNFSSLENLNYVIIQNIYGTAQKKVGYFVVDKKWIAQNTIELTLHCDVVNTFIDDCELSDKTSILRQHKDRFKIEEGTHIEEQVDNVITHPATFYEQEYADELVGYNQSYFSVDSEYTFLYDLIKTGYKYPIDIDESDFEYIDMKIAGSEFTNYQLYFLDENNLVIGHITNAFISNLHDYPIKIGYNSLGTAVVVYYGNNQTATIPDSAQKLAIRLKYITGFSESFGFYFGPDGYDDLEEFQQTYLDSNATYTYCQEEGDYVPQTIVRPEHYSNLIDPYSEGLSPMLYGDYQSELHEDDIALDQDWYLIYSNQNDPDGTELNPITVSLVGSKNTRVAGVPSYTGSYTGEQIKSVLFQINGVSRWEDLSMDNDIALYICASNNPNAKVKISGTSFLGAGPYEITLTDNKFVMFFFGADNFPIGFHVYDKYGEQILTDDFKTDCTITFTDCKTATQGEFTTDYKKAKDYPLYNLFNTTDTTAQLYGIDSIDRTDPKLIKIIKLPYCPAKAYSNNGELYYDPTLWSFDNVSHVLKLQAFDTRLVRYLKFDMRDGTYKNPFDPLRQKSVVAGMKMQEKNILNEPKLYHSDFYQPKYYYDSFSFVFQLEYVRDWSGDFYIQYCVSNTTNSRFMFSFVNYSTSQWDTRDYNYHMIVSRNNEIALFNQQYVNYIRNGYNYEVKHNEIIYEQGYTNWLAKFPTSMISGIKSIATGYAKNDYAGVLGSVSTLGASQYLDHYNRAVEIQERELQMSAKQQQLMNQATGVIDANDIDLLSEYSRNRLKYKIYKASPKMREVLFKMFYYTGYVANIQGIPDTTSRYRFNYVQANVVFKKVPNLPASFINELKQKYSEGITFLHKYNGVIDYDQYYENWETKFDFE